jgi:hypothetical protein
MLAVIGLDEKPGAVAIALMVVLDVIAIGATYLAEEVDGVLPSVV